MGKKQYISVPFMKGAELNDYLIYASVKSYDGKGGCFPSIPLIAKISGMSMNTVRSSIRRLSLIGYLSTEIKEGRHLYKFKKTKTFVRIPMSFIREGRDIPKAYLICLRLFLLEVIPGFGVTYYTYNEIAERSGISLKSVKRYQGELSGYFITKQINRGVPRGEFQYIKVYDLYRLGLSEQSYSEEFDTASKRINGDKNIIKEAVKALIAQRGRIKFKI